MNSKFSRCGFLGVAAAGTGLSRAGTLKGRGVTTRIVARGNQSGVAH